MASSLEWTDIDPGGGCQSSPARGPLTEILETMDQVLLGSIEQLSLQPNDNFVDFLGSGWSWSKTHVLSLVSRWTRQAEWSTHNIPQQWIDSQRQNVSGGVRVVLHQQNPQPQVGQ